jgi:CRISPR-associated protein Cas1
LRLLPFPARQVNLFTGEIEPLSVILERFPPGEHELQLHEDITVIQSPEGMAIHVSGWGASLGKKSERLVLRRRGHDSILWHIPFDQIHEVHISANGVSISSDALGELAERGIRVFLLAFNGKPIAQLGSPNLTATIAIRRAQFDSAGDARGLHLATAMVAGKLLNQARLLKYFGKNLRESHPETFHELSQAIGRILSLRRSILHARWPTLEQARPALMGLEGTAAHHYWNAVALLLNPFVNFPGREHRGTTDFVNAALNYGYGILYCQVWGAVLAAGLEPFAGFLHTDRPGKPSLVLDLTEEFRAPIVDRTVIAALRLRQLQPPALPGPLSPDARNTLVDLLFRRLVTRERFAGGDYQTRSIIQFQARRLASFLLQRQKQYLPFRFKW